MTPDEMREILNEITYKPGYSIYLRQDPGEYRFYVQVAFNRPDIVTGKMGTGWSGKRYVSTHMCRSEFIAMCFGTFLALEEHECREYFKWKNRRIYGPHINVDALWEAAKHVEIRDEL